MKLLKGNQYYLLHRKRVENGKSHYQLANIAIVGEAITLAMRTATRW